MSEFITSSYVYKRLFNYWIICCRAGNASTLFFDSQMLWQHEAGLIDVYECLRNNVRHYNLIRTIFCLFMFVISSFLDVSFLDVRRKSRIKFSTCSLTCRNRKPGDLSLLRGKVIGIVFEIKLETPINKHFSHFLRSARTTK